MRARSVAYACGRTSSIRLPSPAFMRRSPPSMLVSAMAHGSAKSRGCSGSASACCRFRNLSMRLVRWAQPCNKRSGKPPDLRQPSGEATAMSKFSFQQVDVFTDQPLKGNPLAVVVGADGLSDTTMALLGNWTNLSETTFLLKPSEPTADYRVRIFTPERELPFAGHPTLGSCQVWLSSGGAPKQSYIVQECAAGLIRIKRDGNRLAFAAPPLRRTGPVEPDLLGKIAHGLRIKPEAIKVSQWVDNGPGWVAVMLGGRAEVLALKPDYPGLLGVNLGAVGPWTAADGEGADFEV